MSLWLKAAPSLLALQVVCSQVVLAQEGRSSTVAAAPVSGEGNLVPDPAELKMPELAFTPTPADEATYDKYFYFHRDNTSFVEAYADVKECDALASGIRLYVGADGAMGGAMAQYGLFSGALAGALGSVMADAIYGSAARRALRRTNLRNCMNFKEYSRYGLSHDLWEAFNFEEGLVTKEERLREKALRLQALVASGPKPTTKELGL